MKDEQIASLHSALGKELCTFAYRFLGDFSAADDILQEVFLSLRRHPELSLGEAKPYLYRSARNAALNWMRKEGKELRKVRPEQFIQGPADQVEARELLSAAFVDLPLEQYQAAYLFV